MTTVASIQARLGSTRLPGKVLLSLANERVLGWVLARCEATETVDSVVIAVGDEPPNDAITEWCRREGVEHLIGPESDLLERHLRVVNETEADTLVRVTSDCPFIPPAEIDRVVRNHQANDASYTTNHTEGMPIGTALDVLEPELLNKLSQKGETHPVRQLRKAPNDYAVSVTGNPDWAEVADAHIAVDTPEDYWTLTDAVDAVGTDPMAVARWVADRE